MQKISEIIFQNKYVENFPGDNSLEQYSRETPDVFYCLAHPTPVSAPKIVTWSEDLGAELGIKKPENEEEVAVFGGNKLNSSMRPYSARYGGHQFGHWAQQLGDGRAITLGEIDKNNNQVFEIQLKGAGPTAYSRRGDGRAVLRSSLREFLMSEAMFYLKAPTTRALALVTTGEDIIRDMFYDGRPGFEKGAIVTRVAPSFLRFGNFEILCARGEILNLKKLCEWVIFKFYPEIKSDNFELKIQEFFKSVCQKSLIMVREWMRLGFVHGVMNTDNMSILGLTIDYGPFSMLDRYQENFTPNTTDLPGRRYAFGQQPAVLLWNLQRLATALSPLLQNKKFFDHYLSQFEEQFYFEYFEMMGKKLGVSYAGNEKVKKLILDLLNLLELGQFDMTNFYTQLPSTFAVRDFEQKLNLLQMASYQKFTEETSLKVKSFLESYQLVIIENKLDEKKMKQLMFENNPLFIPRNYLLHQCAQELERGESALLSRLLFAIKNPYEQKLREVDPELLRLAPDWSTTTPGSSTLSCSS